MIWPTTWHAKIPAWLLAVLLLAALVGGGGLGLIGLWQAVDLAEGERDADLDRLEVLKQHLAQQSSPTGKADPATANPYLVGETPSMAINGLQGILVQAIEKNGSSVVSFQGRPIEESTGPELRLQVEATFETDLEALQAILFSLETAVPDIFIDSLNVQVVDQTQAGTQTSAAERLRVTLGGTGYWRKDRNR
jgi:hypothetical protein